MSAPFFEQCQELLIPLAVYCRTEVKYIQALLRAVGLSTKESGECLVLTILGAIWVL